MRQVLPELLDSLPHDDPEALYSRDELRWINGIMGNHEWFCRALQELETGGRRILELGAGDGALAQRVWSENIARPEQWCALDLAPTPADWPGEAVWHQRDLLAMPVLPEAEIIVANLVLHHFQKDELEALGQRLPDSCRTLIVCEPARRWVHALQGRLFSMFAELSHVTFHDMFVSIRAGFVGDELPQSLGLHGWRTSVSHTTLGAYRLTAWR